ncbi:excisionase [Clostridioides difficile]|nr:excisionase [Clostridioides difficile]VHZ10246.1 excisionase [Clostridioides difficile]
MNNTDVPIWEKYTLTIEEASKYFRIGEKKLRKLADENLDSSWVIMNGNRIQIKRKQFEKIVDTLDVILIRLNANLCKVSSKKKMPILLVDTGYIDIYQLMKR